MSIKNIKLLYFPKFILDWLQKPILGINKQFDYWLIVHFFIGMIIFRLVGVGKIYLVLGLLIAFELFELFLFKQSLAIPEKRINTLLDIAVGLMGYLIAVGL